MRKKQKGLALREKSFYSYFQALYMSFYSPNLYLDVGRRWRGFGFGYLLLVCAVVSIPWAVKMGFEYQEDFRQHVVPSIKKMPTIYYVKGKLKIDKKMPYIVRSDVTDEPVVIIDNTGKFNSLENIPAMVLFTDNKIITKLQYTGTDVTEVAPDVDGAITPEYLLSIAEKAKSMVFQLLYPSLTMILFGAELASMLFFAYIGSWVVRVFIKYPLSYRQSLRLAYVAATPQITFFILCFMMKWQNSVLSTLISFLFLAYYTFAVRTNKLHSNQLVVA